MLIRSRVFYRKEKISIREYAEKGMKKKTRVCHTVSRDEFSSTKTRTRFFDNRMLMSIKFFVLFSSRWYPNETRYINYNKYCVSLCSRARLSSLLFHFWKHQRYRVLSLMLARHDTQNETPLAKWRVRQNVRENREKENHAGTKMLESYKYIHTNAPTLFSRSVES